MVGDVAFVGVGGEGVTVGLGPGLDFLVGGADGFVGADVVTGQHRVAAEGQGFPGVAQGLLHDADGLGTVEDPVLP